MDVRSTILNFYEPLKKDGNHRYKSWEHCYTYFLQPEINLDYASLHLAFYLASWGMYRGSSDLLQKDYLIHKGLVAHLRKKRHLAGIDFSQFNEANLSEIFELIRFIRKYYKDSIEFVLGEKRNSPFIASDTLVTKILLGTLGCVPAYDRFFIDGIRQEGIGYSSLSESNLNKIVQFYLSCKKEIDSAGKEIALHSGVAYPAMKLVDMYFWSIGKNNEN